METVPSEELQVSVFVYTSTMNIFGFRPSQASQRLVTGL